LQASVARLQSQLDRGEAARQTLEFDLALAKKKSNDIVRSNTHKEVALAKANIDLTGGLFYDLIIADMCRYTFPPCCCCCFVRPELAVLFENGQTLRIF